MKKFAILASLFVLLAAGNLYSQSFTFSRISAYPVVGDTNSYEIVCYGVLRPNSGTMPIRLRRTIQDLTSGWIPLGTGICNYRNCYPPDRDTITENYGPGPGDDTISIHFYCRDINYNFVQGAGLVRIRAENPANLNDYVDVDFRAVSTGFIGIQQISTIVKEFSLNQNYPNPFNPTTNIEFSIPKSEFVLLKVYDILGREVRSLVTQNLTAGEYKIDFDAKGLSSGMYYYSLRAGENVSVKKMVLVK